MANDYPKGPWTDIQKILYDYNLYDRDGTKFEHWEIGGTERVFLVANTRDATNIKIKYDPE
ncbi:hypothetical protein ES703_61562 [subsurface metagenome]